MSVHVSDWRAAVLPRWVGRVLLQSHLSLSEAGAEEGLAHGQDDHGPRDRSGPGLEHPTRLRAGP